MCCAFAFYDLFGEAGRLSTRGRMPPMGKEDGPLGLIAILGTPVLMVVSMVILHLLPREVLTILVTWILASFPIGVLIGHCVLSEE
jgi:hypothetical protein